MSSEQQGRDPRVAHQPLICRKMTLKWAHAGLLGDEDGFFETVDKERCTGSLSYTDKATRASGLAIQHLFLVEVMSVSLFLCLLHTVILRR